MMPLIDFTTRRGSLAGLLAVLAALLGGPLSARPALEKPNLIVVLLDDAGYGDFSHTGNPSIDTPNIDRMVREGAHFPQFYAASPACSASRYSLLTGRNPRRSGFGRYVLGVDAPRYLHPDEVTLAEGLKARGYATAIFGKWHLGNPNAANDDTADAFPLAHGFDRWLGTNVSNDYDPGSHLLEAPSASADPVPGYGIIERDIARKTAVQESLTRRYAEAAIDFIGERKTEPFFIYLALNMPHLPVHASAEFKGRSRRGPYGDCIEEIDHYVGRLLDSLHRANIAENTLVVFTSDNGPWIRFEDAVEHPRYGEARFLVGSALPFRDGKGSTWEGGVRVPGVWWWPGTIKPATRVREPATTMDILPTAFALAGQPLPADRRLDGRDIRGLLNSHLAGVPDDEFVFVYTGSPDNSVYAVRRGPWKLHVRLYSQTRNDYGFRASAAHPLLFNVERDPFERIDLADSHAGTVSELQGLLAAFDASVETEPTYWGAP